MHESFSGVQGRLPTVLPRDTIDFVAAQAGFTAFESLFGLKIK